MIMMGKLDSSELDPTSRTRERRFQQSEVDSMTFRGFRLVFFATLIAAFCVSNSLLAATSDLISETTAAQHGLTRPWFTQTEVGVGFGKLTDLVLFDGTLYAQTDKATVQAIDAETGKTLWSKRVGLPQHPGMTPGVNQDFLAVLNGSRLYVLNRHNGDLLNEKQLPGSPGAGPAISAKRVYVPLLTGLVVAYRLQAPADPMQADPNNGKKGAEKEKGNADKHNLQLDQQAYPFMSCQSFGRVMVQPQVIVENAKEEFAIWPTDRGYLNFSRVDRKSEDALTLKYRLQTGDAVICQPAYLPPETKVLGDSGIIVVGSRDGFAYAFREKDGEPIWRFSVSEPIVTSPVAIDTRVYVASQTGGLYCLNVKTGKQIWFAPDLLQFVSASKTKVYATDRLGHLVVVDAAKGVRLDSIAMEAIPIKMQNFQTDRIYVANEGGLIQCLHEIDQADPVLHLENRKPKLDEDENRGVKQKELSTEKPAKKEHAVAPKDHTVTPKEHTPAPRKTPKKSKKKGAEDAENGDAGGDNAFGAGDPVEKPAKNKKAGKNGKTGKAGKGKGKQDGLDTGF